MVIFFHPDYTVGTGIEPVQLALAGYTAGGESHPALKTQYLVMLSVPFAKRLVKCRNV